MGFLLSYSEVLDPGVNREQADVFRILDVADGGPRREPVFRRRRAVECLEL
jgi:hypothetical protein